MNVPLPEWINFPELLNHERVSKISPFNKDNLAYLISLFITIPARNKKYRSKNGCVINLNSKLLQKYVHNYRQYLEFLIKVGIIIKPLNEKYYSGKFSKQYKLIIPPDIPILPPQEIEINHNPLLKKLVKDKRIAEQRKKISYLSKWFNDKLSFDYDGAVRDLKEDVIKRMQNPESWEIHKGNLRRIHPSENVLPLMYSFNKLKNREFYNVIDESGERLHTNWTNLKKEYRKHLTYNGQELSAMDIKNSQPFFSLILLNKAFWQSAQSPGDENLNFDIFWKERDIKDKINIRPIIMLVESLYSANIQEVKLFTKLVKTGTLYEYFAEQLTKKLYKSYSRDDAKLQLLIVFFSGNQFIGQNAAAPKKVFKSLFPNIYRLYSIIKKNNKPLLACLLQQIESHVVLHLTCKAITDKFPDIPLFTIHDSIVTTLPNLDIIENLMKVEIAKFIGQSPTLKKELWRE